MSKAGKIILIILAIILVGLVVAGILVYYYFLKGPDLSQYEYLKEPQITNMPDQKMIVVDVSGDPSEISGDAISKLFQTFYGLRGEHKDMEIASPRGRWSVAPGDESYENLTGTYGLPIPEEVSELPEGTDKAIKIATWEYGDVAEILHIGPYSEETSTIAKLEKFIEDEGYEIAGLHEEEYLKGPGILWNNPDKYYTIIRYQVQPKVEMVTEDEENNE